jgi:hypothetical protein
MLQLRHAKLELVEIVPRNEVQVLDERAQEGHPLLAGALLTAADPRRELAEQLFERVDDPRVTSVGHVSGVGLLQHRRTRGKPARPAAAPTSGA